MLKDIIIYIINFWIINIKNIIICIINIFFIIIKSINIKNSIICVINTVEGGVSLLCFLSRIAVGGIAYFAKSYWVW
jgi:hypothetical protein